MVIISGIPSLQMRKLKPKEGKSLTEGHQLLRGSSAFPIPAGHFSPW